MSQGNRLRVWRCLDLSIGVLFVILVASAQFATLQADELQGAAHRNNHESSASDKLCMKRQSLEPTKLLDEPAAPVLPSEQPSPAELSFDKKPDLRGWLRAIHINADGTTEALEPCAASETDLKRIARVNAGPRRQREYNYYSGDSFHFYKLIDRREQVSNAKQWPFSPIGSIANDCTGTLIGSFHVLTAAHCVYDLKQHGLYANRIFFPGRNGEPGPSGFIRYRSIKVPPEYVNGNVSWDIAIIELTEAVGVRGKAGRLIYDIGGKPPKNTVYVVGYPGTVGNPPVKVQPVGSMYWDGCTIKNIGDQWLFHNCNTTPGDSGAPIFWYDDRWRDYVIFGVHHGPTTGNLNWGVRINQQTKAWINYWNDLAISSAAGGGPTPAGNVPPQIGAACEVSGKVVGGANWTDITSRLNGFPPFEVNRTRVVLIEDEDDYHRRRWWHIEDVRSRWAGWVLFSQLGYCSLRLAIVSQGSAG